MNKNYKVNEILGAKFFKKIVFLVERIKFKLINKLFPNSEKRYEIFLKKQLDKKLKKEKDEKIKKLLIKDYQNKILDARCEFNNKKNRNYHIKMDDPNKFIKYLKNNRKIHIKGLIRNVIVYLALIPLFILFNPTFTVAGYIILGYNTISTLINFECVNLQNYNLKRFEESKERLIKIKEKKLARDLDKYKNISKVVSNSLNSSKSIPNIDEIVANINTKEELIELKNMLNAYGIKEEKNTDNKVKKIRR